MTALEWFLLIALAVVLAVFALFVIAVNKVLGAFEKFLVEWWRNW